MKLTVRNVKVSSCGGAVPMLCDEGGEPLPNQRGVTIRADTDNPVIVTVEFVTGANLRIIESQ